MEGVCVEVTGVRAGVPEMLLKAAAAEAMPSDASSLSRSCGMKNSEGWWSWKGAHGGEGGGRQKRKRRNE